MLAINKYMDIVIGVTQWPKFTTSTTGCGKKRMKKKNLKINYKFAEIPSIPMDNLKSWGRNGFYIVYRGRGKKMAPTSTNG